MGEMPPGMYPVEGIDSQVVYDGYIRQLNEWDITPFQARRQLGKIGIYPDMYERIIVEGEMNRENHSLRALIMIDQGDERPMGDIYHHLRMTDDGGVVTYTGLQKTRGFVDRRDPHGDKSPFFS